MASPSTRKVWVRRPGGSATLVAFNESDVVDDVRETLLRKYANSLGRVYDAPDIALRLIPREPHEGERTLGPDEPITRTLDVYYPGGQCVDEALVIDVPPVRRPTPNESPRGGPPHASAHASVHSAPGDWRGDYFGPGAVPDYYNHGALTSETEYGPTLAPESAYAARAASAQHLAPASSYPFAHHGHGQQPHKAHGALSLRMPSDGSGGSSGGGAGSSQLPANGGPGGGSPLSHPHSISILATGQAPPIPLLPSPGGSGSRRSHKDRSERPKLNRQVSTMTDDGMGGSRDIAIHVNSMHGGVHGGPNISLAAHQKGAGGPIGSKISIAAPVSVHMGKGSGRSMVDGVSVKSNVGGSGGGGGGGSDAMDMDGTGALNGGGGGGGGSGGGSGGSVSTARNSVASPSRPMSPMRGSGGSKRQKKSSSSAASPRHVDGGGGGGISGGVVGVVGDGGGKITGHMAPLTMPPINVLIVEDNIINLKLLEAFVKRLKVRWQTAMNGRDAVAKWRMGGFHLVLMDIQLPLMSGLEATREIRRLERVNSIGVFASTPSDSIGAGRDPQSDKLANMSLFKSPVIIVALTASSLQSDRNDALAAGCNDFLTKPVNFLWLEKKIMEWGCMQALIDFDGWRKWKELELPSQATEGAEADAASSKKAKRMSGHQKRLSMTSAPLLGSGRDKAVSSDTTATLSSTDSVSPAPLSGPGRGSIAGSSTAARLSKSGVPS